MALTNLSSVHNEPACEHNQAKSERERKAGCPKPQPGNVAGGCAFDGAMITLVPVADVAHVVHGPIGCCGNSWDSRGSLSSGPDLYRRGFTTDLAEHDIVFGGEGKLQATIAQVIDRHDPPAVFVYTTCVPALIGDDVDGVCRAAAAETGRPVIPIHAPGFVGSKSLGNRIAGQALLDQVIGTAEPPDTTPTDICLVGEYNIAGELWEVLPLLDRLGIRVLSTISGDGRYANLTWAHRARATMVVCSKALVNVARGMEERYGIPWFEGSFYGVRATSDALRQIAGILGDPDLGRRTEELIEAEEAAARAALAPWRERLMGKRAVLYTGGVKSWSVVSALQDVGVEVVATGVTKSTDGDVERIRDLLGADAELIEQGNPAGLIDLVRRNRADILIAGGRNQYTAIKARVPFLDINQEREVGYAGYRGAVELARQVDLAITNPVWGHVRRPAPWEAS
jgi:nitrogenase molybdenum-cofactor synthesis protein NifE